MAQHLKSWESPRRQGRNAKGKGGSARQRQLKKQYKMLRKKLKGESQGENQDKNTKKRTHPGFSSFFVLLFVCKSSPSPKSPKPGEVFLVCSNFLSTEITQRRYL